MDNNRIQLKYSTVLSGAVIGVCLFFLIGCETTKAPAPVVERTVSLEKIAEKEGIIDKDRQIDRYYVVQKGDTFYSIALKHGIDREELAEWNNITDTSSIRLGQRINLSVPSREAEPTLYAVPRQSDISMDDSSQNISDDTVTNRVVQQVKTHPKALKLPYSEQNVARLQYSVNPALSQHSSEYPLTEPESGTRIENASTPIERNETNLNVPKADWIWPTTGALLSSFSANSKGLKISGQKGQAVVATAAGEVVYSGNGLRGYGNLIIIKHDEALLSAYAHNSTLLVKEGEAVSQGQKIAEMGDTDADVPQLHFEIRRYGKPIDPLEFLSETPD